MNCAAIHAVADPTSRLLLVSLEGPSLTRLSPEIEADRAQAVADLTHESSFAPVGFSGPFILHLSITEGRLVFDIRDQDDKKLIAHVLALGPFRGLIKDYQMLVESHIQSVHEGHEARIQAIDMGRRGLHNEGAEMMTERLHKKIYMDFPTARRLFTLVCVLHQRI